MMVLHFIMSCLSMVRNTEKVFTMDSDAKFEYLVNQALEDVKSFKGWDFSFLTDSGRMKDAPIKWNYVDKVQSYLDGIDTLLDIGTGGGEKMSLLRPLPKLSYALEDYPPNVEAAKERLGPLGVNVIGVEMKDEPPFFDDLPFQDEYFDLVINRHSSYTVSELYRIMKPGAHYVTQQVGGLTAVNLYVIMRGEASTTYEGWCLKSATEELTKCGFEIVEARDETGYARFADIGAIVYHLIACPWTIEDFSVEKYRDQLLYLHRYIERNSYFDMLFECMFIDAKKPD
jgi:hypothetical protein